MRVLVLAGLCRSTPCRGRASSTRAARAAGSPAEPKMQHLRNHVAMNPKALRRFSPDRPFNHRRASHPDMKFHCEHPSSPSMPVEAIKAAWQDWYTFAPPSGDRQCRSSGRLRARHLYRSTSSKHAPLACLPLDDACTWNGTRTYIFCLRRPAGSDIQFLGQMFRL